MFKGNVPPQGTRPYSQVTLVSAAYLVLLAIAILWSFLRGGRHPFGAAGSDYLEPFWSASIGATAGLLVALVSRLSLSWFPRVQLLEEEFARILGPLSNTEIVVLAVLSSVAEEAFFRGAMQPTLGYVPTALIFGLLHVGPARIYLLWTVMAVVMGFALGAMFLWTGSLLAPILCHLLINAINLKRISIRAGLLEERNLHTT